MKIFAQITKVDAVQGLVYGRIAQEEADASKEIMDYEKSKPNFQKWSDEFAEATGGASVGNVRAMHGNVAAGKLTEINYLDDQKAIDVVAKIIDANELEKCKEGVYTGFSIGGKYGDKWQDGMNKRYVAVPKEVSLVDTPCLKTARFSLIKSDGVEEEKGFKEIIDADLKKKADLEKLEVAYKLKKYSMEGIYDVASALDALRIISYLFLTEAQESEADQITALKTVIENLKNFIASEIKEVDADQMMQMAEKIGTLAKAGARNSKGDLEKLQTIHDHSITLGAACKAEKSEGAEDLQKIEGELQKAKVDRDDLFKLVIDYDEMLKAAADEITTLKAQPEPAKGALKAVTVIKTDDTGENIQTEEEPKTALDALKKVYKSGGVPLEKF